MEKKLTQGLTLGQLLRGVTFLILALALLALLSFLVLPRGNGPEDGMDNPNAHGYLGEPENSLDLIVIGNSDAYSGFSPLELWQSDGVASYVSGIGKQTIFGAYSTLQEVLSCQTPQVVILETDLLFAGGRGIGPYEKLVENRLEEGLPVIRYHDRWKELAMTGLPVDRLTEWDNDWVSGDKGFYFSKRVKANEDLDYMESGSKNRKLRRIIRWELDAFRKTCEEQGIRLILAEFPSESSWSADKHDAVQRYADQYGLEFIDLNYLQEEIGFDWATDTRDGGNHLNLYGARKVTAYLGDYLREHCQLPDHRGEERYAPWGECLDNYLREADG